MTLLNRTIDVQFEFQDLKDRISCCQSSGSCPCSGGDGIDVSLSDVNIQVDLVQYDPSDTEMQVIIGQMIKGDKGDPGYTPQRGIDYWTEQDKIEINNYIDQRIEENTLYWEPL